MAFLTPEEQLNEIHVEQGATVADFGAGTGAYTFVAAKDVGIHGKVYAIDINRDLLEKVKSEGLKVGLENIDVIWGDIEREGSTKLRGGTVDLVIIANILFQVEDKDGMIKEMLRVLKPFGKVFVADWSDSFGGVGPHPEQVFPEAKARELFTKHHFTIEKPVAAGDYHYAFLAMRTQATE